MADYNREKRKYVIGAVATGIVLIYIVRLFTLQIMSDDYKKNSVDFNLNVWKFLTILRRSNGDSVMMIDNSVILSSNSGSPISGAHNLLVGMDSGNLYPLHGQILNLRIFDYLLSFDQINEHYITTKTLYGL